MVLKINPTDPDLLASFLISAAKLFKCMLQGFPSYPVLAIPTCGLFMSASDKLAHSTLINDDHKHVFFDPRSPELHHFVYVDNLGVLAMKESQALAVMSDLDSLFPERGLLLHEASCGSGRRESLGTILDLSLLLRASSCASQWL